MADDGVVYIKSRRAIWTAHYSGKEQLPRASE